MGWVSPKVYAILMKSEDGKDIIEGIGDKPQDQVDREVDAFFASSKGDGKKAVNDAEHQTKNDPKSQNEEDKQQANLNVLKEKIQQKGFSQD